MPLSDAENGTIRDLDDGYGADARLAGAGTTKAPHLGRCGAFETT